MAFLDVLQNIIDEMDIPLNELFERTGIQRYNWDWWTKHPDTIPQPRTLRKLRKALGITFYRDPDTKEITGWAVADPNTTTPSKTGSAVTNNGLAAETGKDYTPDHTEISGSGALSIGSDEDQMMQEYNRLASAYGLHERWEDLSDQRREAWRREYALMRASINQVKAEHEKRLLEVLIGDWVPEGRGKQKRE